MTKPLVLDDLQLEEDRETPEPHRTSVTTELLVAAGAFLVFAVAVLMKAPSMLEPDDFAYRASIIALSHGWIVLSNAQHTALLAQLQHLSPSGISQWDHLANGNWISEKNPCYPFLAVGFYALGILRIAPLFYGLLGCIGLFFGARAWLGKWAGTYSVILFCFSGAAMAFAWRSTMPSFTDASLIAAGAGGLLWALISLDKSQRRRSVIGVLSFVALDLAVFTRYTNIAVLIVGVLAVGVSMKAANLAKGTVLWWAGTVVVFGLVVAAFNSAIYGGVTKTGYASGEITFSASAITPNLEHMPILLIRNMPACVFAAGSLLWIVIVAIRNNSQRGSIRRDQSRRDLLVGVFLAAAWFSIWGLYVAYNWTAQMSADSSQAIHVIRFYVPVLGVMALLGVYILKKVPLWASSLALVLIVVLAFSQFNTLASARAPGAGGFGGGPEGFGSNQGGRLPQGSKRFPGQPGTAPAGLPQRVPGLGSSGTTRVYPRSGSSQTPPYGGFNGQPPNGGPPDGSGPRGGGPNSGGPDDGQNH